MKLPVLCLLLLSVWGAVKAQDRLIYDISSKPKCTVVNRGPTRKCQWAAGLDMTDLAVERGRIVAYKIRWFSGRWSGWYVPGLNDIDEKFNPSSKPCPMAYKANSMRRRWANFYDHTHEFIICKPN
ncbi:hypothetical protein MAR_031809 [Mya arenaria]|uniref:Uncharacterized protein n=1 Tax=Mya arenaria TaxID=6604 RepID=A0ABY7F5S9_MYAAR|nr:uncharacterized protein LOC128206075 [Mya arenaria]WAR17215.1 hypothetical protein MAR_031809 [Mya arenaria]